MDDTDQWIKEQLREMVRVAESRPTQGPPNNGSVAVGDKEDLLL